MIDSCKTFINLSPIITYQKDRLKLAILSVGNKIRFFYVVRDGHNDITGRVFIIVASVITMRTIATMMLSLLVPVA